MENSALRERFERCDTDNNGMIDEKEFGALLDALGVGYDDAQVHAAFEAVDKNQNGAIGFEEFVEWWTT